MKIILASAIHIKYSNIISKLIDESAKTRGTGIARRSPAYIKEKILSGNSVIATNDKEFAGFCYIEVWDHGKYVAHSGLIVSPNYRKRGIGKKIKEKVLDLSLKKYPHLLRQTPEPRRTEGFAPSPGPSRSRAPYAQRRQADRSPRAPA